MASDGGKGRSACRSIHQGDGGNQDQAFVARRTEASAIGKKDQRRKHQHVAEGDGIESFGINARTRRRESPRERVGRGPKSHYDHQARQAESYKSQAAMNIYAAS